MTVLYHAPFSSADEGSRTKTYGLIIIVYTTVEKSSTIKYSTISFIAMSLYQNDFVHQKAFIPPPPPPLVSDGFGFYDKKSA